MAAATAASATTSRWLRVRQQRCEDQASTRDVVKTWRRARKVKQRHRGHRHTDDKSTATDYLRLAAAYNKHLAKVPV